MNDNGSIEPDSLILALILAYSCDRLGQFVKKY